VAAAVTARRAALLALAATGIALVVSGAWIPVKAMVAQALLARAWAAARAGDGEARPWPWADTHPVARLAVPALGVELYVLADAAGRSLAFGPGWVAGSAAPGAPGASVISAHRDTHFAFLARLGPGDDVVLETADGARRHFRLADARVIAAAAAALPAAAFDGPRLVLVTCWPFGALAAGTPWRYVATLAPA
jgi:sortase A